MATPQNQPPDERSLNAPELRKLLRTEALSLDPKMLFYKMGYEAAMEELKVAKPRVASSQIRMPLSHLAVGVAAALLAFVGTKVLTQPDGGRPFTAEVSETRSDESRADHAVIETPPENVEQFENNVHVAGVEPSIDVHQGGVLATLEFVSGAVSQRGFTLSAAGVRLRSPFIEDDDSVPTLMTGLRVDSLEIDI
ncbi:MAG: hypothetical protein AAF802_02160 [Planctomycetota bacterium]